MFRVKPLPTSVLVPETALVVATLVPAAVPLLLTPVIAPSVTASTVMMISLSGVAPAAYVPLPVVITAIV